MAGFGGSEGGVFGLIGSVYISISTPFLGGKMLIGGVGYLEAIFNSLKFVSEGGWVCSET